MGWFGGSNSGDTSGSATSSSTSLDLSSSASSYDDGFASKKRSSTDSYDLSSGFESSAFGSSSSGDVQATIQAEQQKMQLMTAIHKINEVCWDTCIDSVGSSLSGRNESCLRNCAERFVDTTLLITNRFAQLAQKMQGGL